MHQYVGRDLLGIDRRSRRGYRADAVLVDIQVHDDVVVRRDLRFHLQRQSGFFERDAGGTTRGRLLIRNLRALLDRCFDLVGGDHARTRDDLAFAVRLQRGHFHIEEPRKRRVE